MKKLSSLIIFSLTFVINVVLAQPIITSFNPISAKPGDDVVISGSNFNTLINNNTVFFGATKATITTASATSLTVTVPLGATFAPITVFNASTGLIGYSTTNFNPIYSPSKNSIISTDFETKKDYTTGTLPRGVAVADFTGDGLVDIVVANQTSNTVSAFRNLSTLTNVNFSTKLDFATGNAPFSIAVGDINFDGKPDIVVANLSSNSVSVLRNISASGAINFSAKTDFTVGTTPRSVAINDIDGDGKVDIIVTNSNSSTVSILRNTSSSTSLINFATPIDLSTSLFPVSVAVGDIDGDGKVDIVTANQTADNISVFRNTSTTGNISFTTKTDFSISTGPISVGIADFNNDGKQDIAVAVLNSNQVSIFRNTSTSGNISLATRVNFSTGANPSWLSIADFDGDNKPDITTSNNSSSANSVSVLRNTSSNTTSVSLATKVDFTSGSMPYGIATADFNNDARIDIVNANAGTGANSISVLRYAYMPSSNANLNSLLVSEGSLSPSFNSSTTNYTVTLTSTNSSINITPTVDDVNAKMEIRFNGGAYSTIASGVATSNFSLNFGNNTIEVRVTAEDKSTIKTYTVTVVRPQSTDANLTGLIISGGSLSPTFSSNITAYTATVLSTSTVVTITGTVSEPNATIRVNANGGSYLSVSSGIASGGLPMSIGINTVNVEVTAQDGTTKKTYVITVTRPTNIADLSGLTINTGTLSPTFNGGITNYTVSLTNATSGMTVRPTVAVSGATIRVNVNGGTFALVNSGSNSATLPLNTGTNTINIQVTAADGNTVKTYTIIATRALSNNANLSNITLSTGFLSTGFSSNVLSYTAIQQNNTTSVTFTPTASDAGAIIQYRIIGGNFISLNSGTPSASIPLSLGSNIVEILVTAQDGIVTKTYTIDIVRASNNANLSSLITSAGSLTPIFSENTTEYVVNTVVSSTTSTVTITATAADAGATIEARSWSGIVGAGEPTGTSTFTVTSGAVSAPLVLVGYSTVIEVRVLAQDRTTIKTYNIRVLRASSSNANLTALSLTTGTLSPTFSSNTTAYTVNVTNSTTSIRVNFTREIINSIVYIKISGGSYTSYATTGGGSQQSNLLNLNIGSNLVEVLVVAQDGITTKLYTINIVRAGSPNPDLSNLVLSVGSLSPAFSSGNIAYTVTVPANTSTITVTPTAVDANTTIKYGMNGPLDQPINSGSTSPNLPLEISVGMNILQIKVSNAGNAPAKTYTVRINRIGVGPTITSFSPISAKPGDVVTIDGTNFRDANINENIVYFGATKATLTAVTATQITAVVPIGATHSPLTVINTSTGLSANSLQNFNPIYSPSKNSITSNDFAARQNYNTDRRPTCVAVGDLDGDGKSDMVAVAFFEVAGTVTVYKNTSVNGAISFAPRADFSTEPSPQFVALEDVDGDGKLDLVVLCVGKVSILLNTSTLGNISFAAKQNISVTTSTSLAVGDLDGDGKADIVLNNNNGANFLVMRNTSITNVVSFSAPISVAVSFRHPSITLADIDGDRKLDVISSDYAVCRNTSSVGQISFAPFVSIIGNVSNKIITTDIDGDGKLDIVGEAENSTGAIIFKNLSREGFIAFERKLEYPSLSQPSNSIAAGDIDGDGKPDLIMGCYSSNGSINTLSILKNLSTSGIIHFAEAINITTGKLPNYVAIADLDGDTKPDLMSANFDDNNISVFRNAENVLPIVLQNFTANKQNQNTVLLAWKSVSEITAKEYIVEMSVDGILFQKIGNIAAKGYAYQYQFIHSFPTVLQANKLYYRLKMIDNDGTYSFSTIQTILLKQSETIIRIYPNPTKDFLNIVGEKIKEIVIYNTEGKIIIRKKMASNNAITNRLELSNLKNGMYFIEIHTSNGQKLFERIVKD